MPNTARPKEALNSSGEFNEDELDGQIIDAREIELPSMIISDNIGDSFMNDSVLGVAFDFDPRP
jgi:hypothetical protein